MMIHHRSPQLRDYAAANGHLMTYYADDNGKLEPDYQLSAWHSEQCGCWDEDGGAEFDSIDW